MANLKTKIIAATLAVGGLTGLLGCDERRDIVLKEVEINGPIKIQIIRKQITGDYDRYSLEVYDQSGKLRAKLERSNSKDSFLLMDEQGKRYEFIGESLGYKKIE